MNKMQKHKKKIYVLTILSFLVAICFVVFMLIYSNKANEVLSSSSSALDEHSVVVNKVVYDVTAFFSVDDAIAWGEVLNNTNMDIETFKSVYGASYNPLLLPKAESFKIDEILYTVEDTSAIDFYLAVTYDKKKATVLVETVQGVITHMTVVGKVTK